MKRKMFATAVVLIVMAAPLFGAQAAPPAKPAPAQGAAPAKQTADKANEQAKPAAKAPAPPAAPSARVVTPASKPAQTPATAAAKPALPAPAKAVTAAPKPPLPTPAPSAKPATALAGSAKAAAPAKVAAPVVKSGTATLSPVQEKLRGSKELTADVQAKLPGVDVVEAAAGFTDLHLFVSAAYASHNLGANFDALKGKLLSGKRTSLRQAIQEVRPASSAAVEAQRAQYDAAGALSAAERAAKEAANAPAKSDKPAPAKGTPKPKASTPQ